MAALRFVWTECSKQHRVRSEKRSTAASSGVGCSRYGGRRRRLGTGSGFGLGFGCGDGLKDVDVVFAAASLLHVAAARLVAFLLIVGQLSSNEWAAPALVTVLDTSEEDGPVHGHLPARVLAAVDIQRRVAPLLAHHGLEDRILGVVIREAA